jgi:hypothetical protein
VSHRGRQRCLNRVGDLLTLPPHAAVFTLFTSYLTGNIIGLHYEDRRVTAAVTMLPNTSTACDHNTAFGSLTVRGTYSYHCAMTSLSFARVFTAFVLYVAITECTANTRTGEECRLLKCYAV